MGGLEFGIVFDDSDGVGEVDADAVLLFFVG